MRNVFNYTHACIQQELQTMHKSVLMYRHKWVLHGQQCIVVYTK
jgi:hypothetical protein